MTYFLEKETKEKEKVLEKSSFDHFFSLIYIQVALSQLLFGKK